MLQNKNVIIRAKQYIDLQSAVPFVPISIGDKKKTNNQLDETFGYGDDDEEMKESLPLEYGENDQVAVADQYAFFNHHDDATNFQILRQVIREVEDLETQGEKQSPHLTMTDVNDDNLPTSKLENLIFKRPPSPLKITPHVEKITLINRESLPEDVVIEIPADIKVQIAVPKQKPEVDLAQAINMSLPFIQEVEVGMNSGGFVVSPPESKA